MKKLALLFTALLIIISSCSKGIGNKLESDNSTENQLKSQQIKTVVISCVGTCDDGGGKCYFRMRPGGSGECSCEGCTLVVQELKAEGYVTPTNQKEVKESIFSKNLYLDRLDSFVLKKHGTIEYNITSMEYTEFGEEYYIIYDFETAEGVYESVMYAYVKSEGLSSTKGGVQLLGYEIDCSGECEDATQTCREKYNFNPPSAECTCQGSCSMTVHEL